MIERGLWLGACVATNDGLMVEGKRDRGRESE